MAYGVAVDNIPMRGSSGMCLPESTVAYFTAAYRAMDVQLFCSNLAGNRAFHIFEVSITIPKPLDDRSVTSKRWYPCASDFYRPDMSCLVTVKCKAILIEEFIEGLKKAVLENGAAFWDMYQVMGGQNSMINWVNARPPLAAPDYIHFTKKEPIRSQSYSAKTWLFVTHIINFKKHNPNDSTRLGLSSLERVYSDYAEEFEQVIREKLASADSLPEEPTMRRS